MYGCGVYRYLVGAGLQHAAHIIDGAQAAADAERDEYLPGHLFDHVDHGIPGLGRGADIQEYQLIGPFLVIKGGLFNRVARVTQVGEAGAFDHASFRYIQAGYNAFG